MKERQIIYEPHPVSPGRKAELLAAGFKIIDAQFDPNPKTVDASKSDVPAGGSDGKIELGTDSGDQFSDDELRKIIEQVTGQKPHHLLGRAKLVEQFNSLNRQAAGE